MQEQKKKKKNTYNNQITEPRKLTKEELERFIAIYTRDRQAIWKGHCEIAKKYGIY